MPDSPPPSGKPSSRNGSANKRWEPPTFEELQAVLPQYEVLGPLGRGGMGAVYKGRQVNLDRLVAIKILPPDLADDEHNFTERFKNEARAMAKLTHPGIVAVYDFGQTTDGLLYFVMECVEGTDVQQMMAEQGRLKSAHAMAIAAHVCDALQYAHERGIVHRDIKPSNIMVGYDGTVKVADFGLAKMGGASETAGLTRSGVAMGTLHYMAPEALTLGAAVDQRADVYAVGVMLYQMLTGKLPQGLFEMPSLQVPGLDPRYDAIIANSLREDRNVRYQSASELRRDLDGILTEPVVKVKAEAKAAPAALPTQARLQKPGGQPFRPPPKQAAPPIIAKSSSRGVLTWAAVIAGLAVAGFLWMRNQRAPAPTPVIIAETPAPPKTEPPKPAAQAPKMETSNPVAITPTMPAPAKTVVASDTPTPPKTETPPPSPDFPVSESPRLPPELAALDQQFVKLKAERVTAVFDADVAKLNTSYIGGIDREMAKERTAGRLDGVLALEEEKKLIVEKQKIPATEDASTNVAVKNLRVIYRDAFAKLETARTANLTGLTDPLAVRLAALESDLTKQNRIGDAKTAREYREKIAPVSSRTEIAVPTPKPTPTAPTSMAKANARIPADALTFRTSRYAYFSGTHTWKQAKDDAERMGGHLATITTAAEDAWVISNFQSKLLPDRKQFWIGAIEEKPNLPWQWVTGEKFDFTQWAPSEPNNAKDPGLKSKPPYMLGYVFQGGRMGWNDFSESQTNWRDIIVGYLVEWDDAASGTTPAPPATAITPAPAEAGYISLLDADQPGDWVQVGPGKLDIQNGVATTSSPTNWGVAIYSKRTFADFILKAEFKGLSPLFNSGLWLRIPDLRSDIIRAADNRYEVGIINPGGDNGRFTGTIWGIQSARVDAVKANDWNDLEVTVTGQRYLVKLNGQIVNDFTGNKGVSGYIGLEENFAGPVQFRNVRIKEL